MAENPIESTAGAAAELLKAVPIYKDLVQPSAQELGKGLGQVVRAALAPIRLFVLGSDRLEAYVTSKLEEKLLNTPPERITMPPPNVAVPALAALNYTADSEPTLAEMYANLLATAMDRETTHKAHPAFVGMIQQMTSDEARLLPLVHSYKQLRIIEMPLKIGETLYDEWDTGMCDIYLSDFGSIKISEPESLTASGENLARLGLIGFNGPQPKKHGWPLSEKRLAKYPEIKEVLDQLGPKSHGWFRGIFYPTSLGEAFLDACGPVA